MKTNSNLEKEFNLASYEDEAIVPVEEEKLPITLDTCIELDKISAALPRVYGLESTDAELDEIATAALTAHRQLMDLSVDVEQRFCGEIASAASSMLGHAVLARTNKIKKKLDIIALQIKKQVADVKTKGADTETIPGTNVILDRNELLNHLTKSLQNPTNS